MLKKIKQWLVNKFTVKNTKSNPLMSKLNWRDYFEVSKQELKGVFALFAIMIAMSVFLFFYKYFPSSKVSTPEEQKIFNTATDSFLAQLQKQPDKDTTYDSDNSFYSVEGNNKFKTENKKPIVQYFSFNPNETSAEDFEKLGLTQRQIKSIVNYRNKGGTFYNKESFKKIYTITPKDYERLESYITIPEPEYKNNTIKPEYVKKTISKIDIAMADTLLLQELPGIGSGYAKLIATYRYKLGGFANVNQVAEVWNMPDSVYQRILPYIYLKDTSIKTININTAEYKELRKHPYFTEDIARVTIAYRAMHGNFKDLIDFDKVALVDDVFLQKIKPYLRFE